VLMDGEAHGSTEILCGMRSPEDLELTPGNKYLIVSQFVDNRGAAPGTTTVLVWSFSTLRRQPIAKSPPPPNP